MRYHPALLALAVSLVGCGAPGIAINNAQPTPTSASALSRVVTIPPMTAPPRPKLQKGGKSGSSHPLVPPTPMPMRTPTPFPPAAYTAVLQGSVTDAKTHGPLAGVAISVGTTAPRSTTTGPRGRYRIAFPGRAMVPVTVTKKGYAGQLSMGALRQHQTFTLNFALHRIIPGHPAPPSPPGIFGKP